MKPQVVNALNGYGGVSTDLLYDPNVVAHFDDLRMCIARTANQSFSSTFTGSADG